MSVLGFSEGDYRLYEAFWKAWFKSIAAHCWTLWFMSIVNQSNLVTTEHYISQISAEFSFLCRLIQSPHCGKMGQFMTIILGDIWGLGPSLLSGINTYTENSQLLHTSAYSEPVGEIVSSNKNCSAKMWLIYLSEQKETAISLLPLWYILHRTKLEWPVRQLC